MYIKALLISIVIILAIYAFLPTLAIDVLCKFALGWMIHDIVCYNVKG